MPPRLIGPRRANGTFYKKRPAVRKPRAGVSKTAAKTVKNIVKAELSRQAEDKLVSILTTKTHNSAISSAADCYQLVPNCSRGADPNERVGDTIRPKRLKVQIKVRLEDRHYDANNNLLYPIKVRVLILKQKNIKSYNQMATVFDSAHLLRTYENGSGLEIGYTGDTNDDMRMINTDLFDVLMDKKITLRPQYSVFGATADDIKYPVLPNEVVVTKYLRVPAKLLYDDGNGNTCNNYCPFACLGYTYIPGIAGDVTTTQVTCTVLSSLYYEDA